MSEEKNDMCYYLMPPNLDKIRTKLYTIRGDLRTQLHYKKDMIELLNNKDDFDKEKDTLIIFFFIKITKVEKYTKSVEQCNFIKDMKVAESIFTIDDVIPMYYHLMKPKHDKIEIMSMFKKKSIYKKDMIELLDDKNDFDEKKDTLIIIRNWEEDKIIKVEKYDCERHKLHDNGMLKILNEKNRIKPIILNYNCKIEGCNNICDMKIYKKCYKCQRNICNNCSRAVVVGLLFNICCVECISRMEIKCSDCNKYFIGGNECSECGKDICDECVQDFIVNFCKDCFKK